MDEPLTGILKSKVVVKNCTVLWRLTKSVNRLLSTQKDRVNFMLDSMGIPIFPPISENTTTPDELQRTLIDFIQAQWEHTHMQDFLSTKAVPDIPWTDHNFASYLALSITAIPNPSTATIACLYIACLYELLSMIKAHQTDNSSVVLFSIQKSLPTPTPQSPLPRPPSPPPQTSSSRPSSQTSANATTQLSQTATPPQPQPTKKPQLSLPPALSPPCSLQHAANVGDEPQPPPPPTLSPPYSLQHSADMGDNSQAPSPASSPQSPQHSAGVGDDHQPPLLPSLLPPSSQRSANMEDDSQLPLPAKSSPHSLVVLANNPQPPPSLLTPVPSVWGSSLTPLHDPDLSKQSDNKAGRKHKISSNPKDDLASSKKVKLINTDDIVPVAPSRRSMCSKKKEVRPSSGIKAPKPALTWSGKLAKGWVMTGSESDG